MKVVEFRPANHKSRKILIKALMLCWLVLSIIICSITAAAEMLLMTPIRVINIISTTITKVLMEAAK